jgi:hypothetical protein
MSSLDKHNRKLYDMGWRIPHEIFPLPLKIINLKFSGMRIVEPQRYLYNKIQPLNPHPVALIMEKYLQ